MTAEAAVAVGRAARPRAWLDRTLWGEESGARVYVVHTGLAAIIGARIALGPFRQLAGTPGALFDPVPILAWLPTMPPVAVIVAIQLGGFAAAVAAVMRHRTRATFAIAWVCYLVLAGLRSSRGKVLHNDLLLLWVAAPFLLAPLHAARSELRRSRSSGWPIRVAVVITALIYGFAGYHKLRRSGIDWVLGDNLRYVARWGPSIGQPLWPGLGDWVAARPWAAKLTGAATIVVELGFPLGLVWRRLLPWLAAGAVVLHAGTYLMLGLDYWAWMLAVPLVVVDWPSVVARVRSGVRSGARGSPPHGAGERGDRAPTRAPNHLPRR